MLFSLIMIVSINQTHYTNVVDHDMSQRDCMRIVMKRAYKQTTRIYYRDRASISFACVVQRND